MPIKVRYVAFALLAVLAGAAPANAHATNDLRQRATQERVRTSFPYRRDTVWDRLAECETGGNWRHRTATYQGGLGFYHGSWDAYRPRAFPREAYLATREEQIAVGRRIKADVGWGAWPACSVRLGLR